jgi:hypothetical protein
MLIQLPFSGFYNSIHDVLLDDALESLVQTENGITNEALLGMAYFSIDFNSLHTDYAKKYTDSFAHKFKLDLSFNELNSPREYNLTTDKIYCEISYEAVKQLWRQTAACILENNAEAIFTSRDGFNSFYSHDYKKWGAVKNFDCNHLHCLLCAWLETNHADDYNFEEVIAEDLSCNGYVADSIYKNSKDKRAFNIAAYLNQRATRKIA